MEITKNSIPAPRPFYIIGHNTNTIEEVRQALDAGANAIEPDVNVYLDRPSELCISHWEGLSSAPSLVTFLKDLCTIALEDRRLSLIVFDCKTAVSTPEHGRSLLTAIRKHLSRDTGMNIIFSVSGLDKTSIFDQIIPLMEDREGFMIDESNDVDATAEYFKRVAGKNTCYANGTSLPVMPLTGPHVLPSVEKAVAMRAASGTFSFIGVWTVNGESLKDEFIRVGVDGIISDYPEELSESLKKQEFRSLVRLADRQDNPFRPANQAYGLTVFTGNQPMAGTDSGILFTLTGTEGSTQMRIDSSYRLRMERGQVNFITIQSGDLGKLISISLQADNKGVAPDWYLEKIVVESALYKVSKEAHFGQVVGSLEPVERSLI